MFWHYLSFWGRPKLYNLFIILQYFVSGAKINNQNIHKISRPKKQESKMNDYRVCFRRVEVNFTSQQNKLIKNPRNLDRTFPPFRKVKSFTYFSIYLFINSNKRQCSHWLWSKTFQVPEWPWNSWEGVWTNQAPAGATSPAAHMSAPHVSSDRAIIDTHLCAVAWNIIGSGSKGIGFFFPPSF